MTESKKLKHITIEYTESSTDGSPDRVFRVVLGAESRRFFEIAARHITRKDPNLHNKGEELVAEILKCLDGGISEVERFSARKGTDGSNPSKQEFSLSDGINGEPARQEWNNKLNPVREDHYDEKGEFSDSINGVPATRLWNNEGILTNASRFLHGERNDSPDGDLAVKVYSDDGELASAWSYKNDESVKRFSKDEFIAYEKTRKTKQFQAKAAPSPQP